MIHEYDILSINNNTAHYAEILLQNIVYELILFLTKLSSQNMINTHICFRFELRPVIP